MAKKEEKIGIKPLKLGVIKVKVKGMSPYLPEPMDKSVADRYDRKKSNQVFEEDTRSEEEKVKEKFYRTSDGGYGIPARAFYNAMIRASTYFFDIKSGGMRNIKEGIIVRGNILPLKYKSHEVVEHIGRQSGRTKAPRKILRNAFNEWSCTLEIQFNQNQLSAEQIVNILNWAGFHIGVGGFRKEKTGNYGMFQVEP
jgi:hypothetical protein